MKQTMQYLEQLFVSELPGYKDKYPPQLRKSVAQKLLKEGLIQEVKIVDRDLSLTCHQLTHRGMMEYCEWASKQLESDQLDIS